MKALFIPGLCCRSEIWERAAACLPGVDVVALDWPWPERIRSYDEAADWLGGEIRRHDPQLVVGHSFGGVIALHLAARAGSRPDWSLVVVDAFLVTPHPFFRNHVWLPAPELRERIARMIADERPRFPILREVATAEDPAGWRERVLSRPARYLFGGRSGERDAATLGEWAGVPAAAGHEVRVIPETAHFPMLERPDVFYATLRDVTGLASREGARPR